MSKVCAFLLAAGLGTRLRPPVGMRCPKPLIPLPNGDSLIGTVLSYLKEAGIQKFIVNTHYAAEALEAYLKSRDAEIEINHEEDLLNTGGPLIQAAETIRCYDACLLHNGDILTDMQIRDLIDFHQTNDNLLTMALIQGPENRILLNAQNEIIDVGGRCNANPDTGTLHTYMGVAVFHPRFLDYFPKEVQNFDIRLAFVDAIQKGERVQGYCVPQNTYWNDLGTLEKYLLSAENLPQYFNQCVYAPSKKFGFEKLAEQGSMRSFYRLTIADESSVLMRSYAGDPDFKRFIDLGTFLHALGVGTPKIKAFREDSLAVLMEDLGNDTLDLIFKKDPDNYSVYEKVIVALAKYNVLPLTSGIEKVEGVRNFDYDYLRWETQYFKDHLLIRHAQYNLSDEEVCALEGEFARLAQRVDAQPKVWMHRDCQSQNILIHQDEVRFVDFQGGRVGPLGYDIMSLLYDPYVEISSHARERLLKVYYTEYLSLTSSSLSYDTFRQYAIEAGLQRLMQALGAYGFLSYEKGKMRYLDFIPVALPRLHALLQETANFPVLLKIVSSLV